MEQNENMTSVVIEQEGENKKRSALAVILALAVVVILGIGTTFAYLSYTGNQTPNRFTTDSGISCDLLEPAWTAALEASAGTYPDIASDGSKIPTAANNTGFKTVIAKDPYVVNTGSVGNDTGDGVNEFVGIRLTFQKWVAKTSDGAGAAHEETGQYVTMTDDEVAALMKVYAFTTDTAYTEADTMAGTEATPAGLTLGNGWTQSNADGAVASAYNGKSQNGSMYFTYDNPIKSIGQTVTEETDPTVSKAADDVETASTSPAHATTTNLFKSVIQVADKTSKEYKDFLDILYSGSVAKEGVAPALAQNTTDPGWRVLVSAAATDATYPTIKDVSDISGSATSTLASSIRQAINAKHVANNVDGSSATITGRDTNSGSGYRGDVSVPESEWNY